MPEDDREITILLNRAFDGDEAAREDVFQRVYERLRGIALGPEGRRCTKNGTLSVTALVNETYLKLFSGSSRVWQNRTHFYAFAATAMRHIVLDHARQAVTAKRGGEWTRVELLDTGEPNSIAPADLIALDEALARLAELNPRQASVVEMRYFAGMSFKEIADVLSKSVRTIELDWRAARAWLKLQLEP